MASTEWPDGIPYVFDNTLGMNSFIKLLQFFAPFGRKAIDSAFKYLLSVYAACLVMWLFNILLIIITRIKYNKICNWNTLPNNKEIIINTKGYERINPFILDRDS